MNQIEKLIKQYCPERVEYKELGEVINYEQPARFLVDSIDYDNGYSIPVLTAGQTFILGYTDESDGIFEADNANPVIIFDDFTTSFHWVDFRFKIKSSAMKLLRPKNNKEIDFRYVFYAMNCIFYKPQDHSRQWISRYSKFSIPIPPLPVQEAIVSILDKFTSLEAELEAELEARRAQYDYYRNQLLTPVKVNDKWMLNGVEVEWKTLGGICNQIFSGKNKERNNDGLYPVYGSTGIIAKTNRFVYKTKKIIIARVGANAGKVQIADGEYDVSDNAMIIDLNPNINLKYIYYLLIVENLNHLARGGGQPLITAKQLKEISLPLPPPPAQQRIVSILDKFDSLVNDISIGLPAEIESRRKQYEYYREKLLTFKKAEPLVEVG